MRAPGAGIAALALVVVLGGCAGMTPGSDETTSTETVSPAPLPETPGELPPWAAGGEVDSDALVDAHRAALSNGSYRVVLVWNKTVPTRYGAVRSTMRSRLTVGSRTNYRLDLSALVRGGDRRIDVAPAGVLGDRIGPGHDAYADGTAEVVRYEDARNGTQRRQPGVGRYEADVVEHLREYLDADEMTVREVERNGTTWYQLRGDGQRDLDGVKDFHLHALVSPDGVVRELSVRYVDIEGAVRVTIRHPETTVEEVPPPGWYENVHNGSDTATPTPG